MAIFPCYNEGKKTRSNHPLCHERTIFMNLTQTEQAYTHAKQIIPGGVQLLSKRPEQFAPNQWPS